MIKLTIILKNWFWWTDDYVERSFLRTKLVVNTNEWIFKIRTFTSLLTRSPCMVLLWSKENWIQGGGNRVSVHFDVTFLDCWRTSFCVTTIIKIVNNNTNDKQTSGASLALDEDSPHTSSCLFTLDQLPLLLLLCKN